MVLLDKLSFCWVYLKMIFYPATLLPPGYYIYRCGFPQEKVVAREQEQRRRRWRWRRWRRQRRRRRRRQRRLVASILCEEGGDVDREAVEHGKGSSATRGCCCPSPALPLPWLLTNPNSILGVYPMDDSSPWIRSSSSDLICPPSGSSGCERFLSFGIEGMRRFIVSFSFYSCIWAMVPFSGIGEGSGAQCFDSSVQPVSHLFARRFLWPNFKSLPVSGVLTRTGELRRRLPW